MRRRNAGDAGLRQLERQARADPTAAQSYGHALIRAGRFDADVARTLDSMGPEAWRAWLFDGEHEWRPADASSGVVYPDPVENDEEGDAGGCEDPNGPDCHDDTCPLHYGDLGPSTWRRMISLTGLAVRRRHDGSPMLVRTYWTIDDADNADSTGEDNWPIGSPESDLALARRARDTAQGWVAYFAWAEERGEDPLNELRLVRREPESAWRFELEPQAKRGRRAKTALMLLRKAWQRRGRRWVAVPITSLPDRVRAWLAIQDLSLPDKLEVVLPGREVMPTELEVIDAAAPRRIEAQERLGAAVRNVGRLISVANAIIEVDTSAGVERLMRSQVADRFVFEVGMVLTPGDPQFQNAVRAVDEFVSGHRHSQIRVIAGPDDGRTNLIYNHATSLFWNNEMGWVDRGAAHRFESREGLNLPPGGAWVTVAELPTLPHDPDCHCMECIHDVEFCPACGNTPGEGNVMDEHEADCSSEGEMVCASHHVCDVTPEQRRLAARARPDRNSSDQWAHESGAPRCPAACPRCGHAGNLHHEGGEHYCAECDDIVAGSRRLEGCPGVEDEDAS